MPANNYPSFCETTFSIYTQFHKLVFLPLETEEKKTKDEKNERYFFEKNDKEINQEK